VDGYHFSQETSATAKNRICLVKAQFFTAQGLDSHRIVHFTHLAGLCVHNLSFPLSAMSQLLKQIRTGGGNLLFYTKEERRKLTDGGYTNTYPQGFTGAIVVSRQWRMRNE
jgi:hypothetical protein